MRKYFILRMNHYLYIHLDIYLWEIITFTVNILVWSFATIDGVQGLGACVTLETLLVPWLKHSGKGRNQKRKHQSQIRVWVCVCVCGSKNSRKSAWFNPGVKIDFVRLSV